MSAERIFNQKIAGFLEGRTFISVATSDLNNKPNAAPKFILKVGDDLVYLVDYNFSRTWENIKLNPRVSMSFIDSQTLFGYQINGAVKLIEKGPEYEKIVGELSAKKIQHSVERIIEGLHKEHKHQGFEIDMPERFVIYKISVQEVLEISPKGDVKSHKLENI